MKTFLLRCLKRLQKLLVGLIILIALFMGVMTLLSPFMQRYQATIEHWLSQQLSATVKVDHFALSWHFYQPVIKLTGVTVDSQLMQRRWHLTTKTVRIACSVWRSLLGWQFIPDYVIATEINAQSMTAQTTVVPIKLTADKITLRLLTGLQSFELRSYRLIWQQDSLFPSPIMIKQLAGRLKVKLSLGNTWEIVTPSLTFWNDEVAATVKGQLQLSTQQSPMINLEGYFTVPHAPTIFHYLPLKQLNPQLVIWLQHAFSGGCLSSGKVIVHGKASDFPFNQKNGQFLVTGRLDELNLRFSSDWPTLSHIHGQLTFSGEGMDAKIDRATLFGIPITNLIGTIPSLTRAPLLSIQSDPIQASIDKSMQFIATSPLQKTIGESLKGIQLSGEITLKLALMIPLSESMPLREKGQILLKNIQLTFPDWRLAVKNLQGSLQFTEQSLQAPQLTANLFNKPISLSLSKKDQSSAMQIRLSQEVTVQDIEHWLSIPLTNLIEGSSKVDAQISLTQAQHLAVNLKSSLKGVTIMLPGRYGKVSHATKALQIKITVNPKTLTNIRMQYGPLAIKIIPANKEGEEKDHGWEIFLKDDDMEGRIWLPVSITADQPIQVQSKQVNLNAFLSTSLETPVNLSLFASPILFRADSVYYQGIDLGMIHFRLAPIPQGLAITEGQIHSPLMIIKTDGFIKLVNRQYQVQFAGKGQTSHASQLLAQLGFPLPNVVLQEGTVSFNLQWKQPTLFPAVKNIHGQVSLWLNKGRILQLDQSSQTQMWLGQLLNLLSLQAIPRHLSLDFSDVLEKGYRFDSIKGDFDFNESSIYTQQANMEGPVAKVKVSGEIDTIEKSYDLVLSITPYVTASLPVAAALLTGQPAIGLAAWVVSQVASSQISKATTYYYAVTGPWDNPSWEAIRPHGQGDK